MQSYFFDLATHLGEQLRGDEIFTSSFAAEDSDFVRFNHSQVRQAGSVVQRHFGVDLIDGRRHAAGTLTLSGDMAADRARLGILIEQLRETRRFVPEDPYLLYATAVRSTEHHHAGELPERTAAVAQVQEAGRGRDLVGIYAAGASYAGFANSFGQRNWYSVESYNLDWSFFHSTDKAVKEAYAGFRWNSREFEHKVQTASEQLRALSRPARTIAPGRYRVYLAPAAVYDIVGLLGWGGFGLRAHRTKTTPLLQMIEGQARLNPAVDFIENTRDGFAPDFQEAGFIRPEQVPLIRAGAYEQCLVSPRSALEFQVPTNGASSGEAPDSIDLGPGSVAVDRVLQELHTGIYVSNLWYLNFSDRPACRTTGMTRFATFWVENGAIQEPLNVMRFDETIYRILGENLIGLTAERETILDPGTYDQRSLASARLPGALVDQFTFTL